MNELSVPIVLFISLAAVIIAALFFKTQVKRSTQETLRAALQRGDALSPELVEALAKEASTPLDDFRRGVTLIALGVGIVLFGYFVDPGETELMGIAAIPAMLGVGYLIVWRFGPRE